MAAATEAFCEHCQRFVAAAEDEAARCPECGGSLRPASEAERTDAPVRAPWHFKLLVVGTIGYLIYRLIWFIGWLTHHL